mgnify:CR=1 FL=1
MLRRLISGQGSTKNGSASFQGPPSNRLEKESASALLVNLINSLEKVHFRHFQVSEGIASREDLRHSL